MVRVVLDTNVFISMLLKSRNCLKIRETFLNNLFEVIISPNLMREFLLTVRNEKFKDIFSRREIENLIELINTDMALIIPEEKISICRDSADNIILECAAAGKADFIVTGDNDLLALKSFRKIRIITPINFLKIL